MNSRKSLVVFTVAIFVSFGVMLAFAHGTQQETTALKVAWMGGSAIVAAAGVLLSYKLGKKK